MAFPFWWMGAALATVFLALAFTLFGAALRMLAWTAGEMRQSMLPGVVAGFRGWAGTGGPGGGAERESASPRMAAAGEPGDGSVVEELIGPGVATVPARRQSGR